VGGWVGDFEVEEGRRATSGAWICITIAMSPRGPNRTTGQARSKDDESVRRNPVQKITGRYRHSRRREFSFLGELVPFNAKP
jgi:hypothetical protein